MLLLVITFAAELLNIMVYLLFNFFIIPKVFPTIISGEKIDILSHFAVAICALIIYFIIGKKIFIKIDSEKAKFKIATLLAIIILISYTVISFSSLSEVIIAIHWDFFSPIAYVLLLPLRFFKNNVPLLAELLFVLLSPISVLLIWLFSKIGNGKKKIDN